MSPQTLLSLFTERVQNLGDRVALKQKRGSDWVDITWKEWQITSERLATGLISLGVGPGDKVCILSNTRAEWAFADTAIMMVGAITVPIYQSTTAEQAAFILHDSQTRVVICEDPLQLGKIYSLREKLPALERLIYISPVVDLPEPDAQGRRQILFSDVTAPDDPRVLSWTQLLADGESSRASSAQLLKERAQGVRPDSLAILVYTSGTTGIPKGVMLTHGSLLHTSSMVTSLYALTDDDVCLCFLPLAHMFGKCILSIQLKSGYVIALDSNLARVAQNLQEIKPTFTAMVPRFLEKLYARLKGAPPPAIKGAFGGRLRVCVVSGAALSKEINEFFSKNGVPLYDSYAATETTGIITGNFPHKGKGGTVGTPPPGTEIRIAADGEILVSAPNLMNGYYNRPEETRAALEEIDAKLWYHTGDVGEIDEEGFLRITDRKKDLFKTSGGKYIAPQMLENLIKAQSKLISQAMAYGENRNYVTALLTLSEEDVSAWARAQGVEATVAELAKDPRVREQVARDIEEVNSKLASFETIKKFVIVYPDLSLGAGDLTPTAKLKRKAVLAKYGHLLDALYS